MKRSDGSKALSLLNKVCLEATTTKLFDSSTLYDVKYCSACMCDICCSVSKHHINLVVMYAVVYAVKLHVQAVRCYRTASEACLMYGTACVIA
jgi:hypothetical protein